MIAALTARARRLRHSDAGFSLTELMISMSVMGVVTIISASGFLGMFRTADLTETAALAQTSTLASFSKLDRDVRYAARINAPYLRPNGDYAVEYVLGADSSTAQCVRLTLPVDGGTLTRLQWLRTGPPGAAVPSTVALDLQSADAAGPFALIRSGTDGSNFDRLEVRLRSSIGVEGAGASRVFDLRFTALNTAAADTVLTCDQS